MSQAEQIKIYNADCIKALKDIPSNSIDSLVTDPPAGISFMGKEWDSSKGGRAQWISWMMEVMMEANRVMKPGAHGFVWAIPRTSHWTATALENAGFEIRDVVTHVFGSGFPKSLNVSKAIDKAAGAQREKGFKPIAYADSDCWGTPNKNNGLKDTMFQNGGREMKAGMVETSYPATDAAKEWDGWGTALKPASEHWILVRKPLSEKTIVDNVLKHGTGGINIDESRIHIDPNDKNSRPNGSVPLSEGGKGSMFQIGGRNPECDGNTLNINKGRFPANFICSGEARDMLDEQSGISKSIGGNTSKLSWNKGNGKPDTVWKEKADPGFGDTGGASRFFYCAKPSKKERNAGLKGMPKKFTATMNDGIGKREHNPKHESAHNQNHHPTVKPKKLMKYLIKMITPPGGTVLDPFMGSGSTGIASIESGFKFIGIEAEKEYCDIAERRIRAVQKDL